MQIKLIDIIVVWLLAAIWAKVNHWDKLATFLNWMPILFFIMAIIGFLIEDNIILYILFFIILWGSIIAGALYYFHII